MPKVSVVIPVYGVELYIEKCARSLFEQTLDDIEFLFINDCTLDKSMDVLKDVLEEYPQRKSQVKIICNKINLGQHGSRQIGISLASGDYVIHCDSDDWVEKDMYEALYKEAVENDYDYVWCDYQIMKGNRTWVEKQDNICDKISILKRLLIDFHFMGALWNRLVKRCIVQNNTLQQPVAPIIEDLLLVIQYTLLSNKIGYLSRPLYNYLKRPGSIMDPTCESNLEILKNKCMMVRKNFLLIQEVFLKKDLDKILKDEIRLAKFRQKQKLIPIVVYEKNCKIWKRLYPEINVKLLFDTRISLFRRFISLLIICNIYPYVRILKLGH